MRTTFDEVLRQSGTMILDGAMATELEAMGCDLNDSLWSAKVLAEAPELIGRLQNCLETPGKQADARAAVWEAFLRQNPDLLTALPAAWRTYSARTLTDLMATELGGLEATLEYLTAQPGLTVQYTTAETQKAGPEVILTDSGMQTMQELLG